MATPIHTGATVYLVEYHGRIAADVYVVAGAVLLTCAERMRPNSQAEPGDYRLEIKHGYWNKVTGYILVPLPQLWIPEAEEDRWFEAGYRLTEKRTPVLD